MKTLVLATFVLVLSLSASPVIAESGPGPLSVTLVSDTQGVNFGPYMRQAIQSINKSWTTMSLQGLAAHPSSTICFSIDKDGSAHFMELLESAQVLKLDRAAWGSIVNVGQFPVLPASFSGSSLVLDVAFQVKP